MTAHIADSWLKADGCLAFLPDWWNARISGTGDSQRLARAAAALPPIPRLALEVRLGKAAGRIDLHQLVAADPLEQARLVEFVSHCPADQPGLASLRRFVQLWADPARELVAILPNLYLEFDQDAAGGLRSPCLFLDLHRRLAPGARRKNREEIALELVDEALAAAGRPVPPELGACIAVLPAGASIGHLGLMFGRDEGWLRVNVKQLQCDELAPLLRAIGWPGDVAAAEARFVGLLDQADRVTVALDLNHGWRPEIGFELFFDARPARDTRWKRTLDRFHAEGLAAEAERAALLAFDAVVLPDQGADQWPAPWIVAATLAPRDRVPKFSRFVSHLKVSVDEAGASHAKAYLALAHEWERLGEAPHIAPAGAAPVRREAIAGAIDAGVDYLASRVTQGGFWCDFHLKIGFADEWVTAFVAAQLLHADRPKANALARRAWPWLLRRQRAAGGWGFNGVAPPDADSTAWVLRLAEELGREGAEVARARDFLAGHMLADGGVTTYAATTPVQLDGQALSPDRREGWGQCHGCVVANAAPFLPPAATDWLRRRQTAQGAWESYWWSNDLFATALAAEAQSAQDSRSIARAAAWAWSDAAQAATAWDRAWQLRLAMLVPEAVPPIQVEETAARLLFEQQADGGWPPGASMLYYQPWETEREGNDAVCLDQERCFTTAAVVGALGRYERARRSGGGR